MNNVPRPRRIGLAESAAAPEPRVIPHVDPPGPRGAGRLSREAAERLTEEIVAAAEGLFAEKGFGATTIEDVADICHTTPRSVVRRFPTKEHLLIAAVGHFARRITTAWASVLQHKDLPPMARLRTLLRVTLALSTDAEGNRFFFVLAAEAPRIPQLKAVMRDNLMRWEDDLRKLFAEAQGEGRFQRVDAAALASGAMAMLASHALIGATMLDRLGTAEADEAYFEAVWSLIAALQ